MKNSDLFLELFDDDLLKPQNTSPVVDKKIDEVEIQNEVNLVIPSSSKCAVRTEFDICAALDKEKKESETKRNSPDLKEDKSLIHNGDTDSSDDEDNKYMDSYNYDDFGRDVKRLLLHGSKNESLKDKNNYDECLPFKSKDKIETSICKEGKIIKDKSKVKQLSLPEKPREKSFDVYADPFFGLRIVTPLISSQGIQIRMSGKTAVFLNKLRSHLAKSVETDFVVAGVIVRSVTKQSQNGNHYLIWEISDLKDDLASVPIFLFGQSYKDLWKTQIGTVVAILNPTNGNKKGAGASESFNISVKFSDQVMIWGRSKDYGVCKSIKKNGEKCSMFVNKSRCEYCTFHVKKEYSKFSSSRSEIQSPGGSSSMNFLRNKVLGKNEIFYGGKSYSAIKGPSEKAKEEAKKLNPKDQLRLSNLGITIIEKKVETKSSSVSLPHAPRAALALKSLNMDSKILQSLSLPNEREKHIAKNIKTSHIQNSPVVSKDITKVPKLNDPEMDGCKKLNGLSLSNDSSKGITNSKSLNSTKYGTGSNNLSKFLSKVPSLSNPEEDCIKTSDKPDIVSQRSKLLFQEAVSDKESPKSKSKKSLKPSLSDNRKPIDKVKVNNKKSKIASNLNCSKAPVLSDPSKDFDLEITKSSSNSPAQKKDLHKRFKSLLEIESRQKIKNDTLITNDSTFDFKSGDDLIKNQTSNEKTVVPLKDVSKSVENIQNEASPKPVLKSITNQENENAVSSSPNALNVDNFYRNQPSSGPFMSPSSTKVSKAKARALMFVKRNGPIVKADPNTVKKTPETATRKRERSDSHEETGDGKVVFSELYLKLMKETSAQQDLVEAEKIRVEEEYFEKMGLKEQLEEKMLNTYKIDCKAVKCIQCKYIWFSAADFCKAERHVLKIVDTVKRFFKCGNCGNRTVSLHVVPMFSCKNCSGSNWQRAPMMREKVVKMDNQLSIRGGEQQFFNSHITNSSLNLIVPD